MNPAALQGLLQRAVRHHRGGELEKAARLYEQVLASAPRNFDALHLGGTVAIQQGFLNRADSALALARAENPGHALCAMRHGVALYRLGRLAEAEQAIRTAIRLEPDGVDAWTHLATLQRRTGRPDEALASLERARELAPARADVEDQLGALLAALRGHAAAEPHFRRAVELRPDFAGAWSNLGTSLLLLSRLGEASVCFDRAISINPKLDHAHAGRGLVLAKCLRLEASAAAYRQAIALNPRNHQARSALLYERHFSAALSPAELFDEHRAFGRAVSTELAGRPAPAFPNRRDPGRRLRVGFLSPDLVRHSVSYFLEPILSHLDSGAFAIALYHDQPGYDEVSGRLRAHAEKWECTAGLSDDALEAAIRRDEIDILIDLAGHTGGNRLPFYARRSAPVQATYLGYPDTTGLAEMDFRLVDFHTDPAGTADRFATERLVRFAGTAWSYLPPQEAPEPSRAADRAGDCVTFGCFNQCAKISDQTVAAWARLLGGIPGSRLLLKSPGLGLAPLAGAVRQRFADAGIDPARLGMLERTHSVAEHLAAYKRVDVSLDPFPYHGTTTTCESLWMGVPVVTLAGDRHASRVGLSLLSAVGHPEWIASDWNDYVRIAAALAAAASARDRAALRSEMNSSPLLDHRRQADLFGAALRRLWMTWCDCGEQAREGAGAISANFA